MGSNYLQPFCLWFLKPTAFSKLRWHFGHSKINLELVVTDNFLFRGSFVESFVVGMDTEGSRRPNGGEELFCRLSVSLASRSVLDILCVGVF